MVKRTKADQIKFCEDSIRKYHPVILKLFEYSETHKAIKKKRLENGADIYDFSFYHGGYLLQFSGMITISLLDMMSIVKFFQLSTLKWEATYLLRSGYVLVYETLNTFKTHNIQLKKLSALNGGTTSLYKNITDDIKYFKKEFDTDKTVKDVRHMAGGHIESDILKFKSAIDTIDFPNAVDTLNFFVLILKKMEAFVSSCQKILSAEVEEDIEKMEVDFKPIQEYSENLEIMKKVRQERLQQLKKEV